MNGYQFSDGVLFAVKQQLQRTCETIAHGASAASFLALIPRLASRDISRVEDAIAAIETISDEEHEAAQVDVGNIAAKRETWTNDLELRHLLMWLIWLWWSSLHGIGFADWRRTGLFAAVIVSHKLPVSVAESISALLTEVQKSEIVQDMEPIANLSDLLLHARRLSEIFESVLTRMSRDQAYHEQLVSDVGTMVVGHRSVLDLIETICLSDDGLFGLMLKLEDVLRIDQTP